MIDYFIENLTGIKNSQVKKAPKLDEALIHMIDWLGERDYKIYAWSESDRNQLLHEIKAKNMTDERIYAFMKAENWIDYQDVFTKRFELSRQLSLEEALGRAEIEPEGKFHDGLDDAVNTAYLIEKGYPGDKLSEVIGQAQQARANGEQVLVVRMNKNKKFQKEQLSKEGYEEFVEFFK